MPVAGRARPPKLNGFQIGHERNAVAPASRPEFEVDLFRLRSLGASATKGSQTEHQFSLDRGSSLVVRDNGSLEGAVVFGVFDAADHGLGT
jgi:hypothetical protein